MREMLFVSPTVDSTVQLVLSPPPKWNSHPLRAFLLFLCASISSRMLDDKQSNKKRFRAGIERKVGRIAEITLLMAPPHRPR